MSLNEFSELRLLITGPTYLREEVKAAGRLPEFGHRDLESEKRFGPILENLRLLAGADDEFEVFLVNGSGSTVLETSIRSLVADNETVLNVSVGAFGDLYHRISVANGKDAELLRFDYGETVDLQVLEERLSEAKPGVVTLTHNETSTGVMNDIVAACHLIREHGAMALVDGVSIFGGAEIRLKEARPAMYCTATQKGLGLPAGFGIGFVSPEALRKAESVSHRGYSSCILNQVEKARKAQVLTTPNCTLANQMAVQLDYIVHEEGIQRRFDRHIQMRRMVADWVAGLRDYELLAPEGHRSPTLTALRCPVGVTASDLKNRVNEALRARGYLMDPGYGRVNADLEAGGCRSVFRIGHMGDITPAMLEEYLAALETELLNLTSPSQPQPTL